MSVYKPPTEFEKLVEEVRSAVKAIDYSVPVSGRCIWMNHSSKGCNKHRALKLWNPPTAQKTNAKR